MMTGVAVDDLCNLHYTFLDRLDVLAEQYNEVPG